MGVVAKRVDHTLARIHWQCRRGSLELDYVLAQMVEQHFDLLSAAEREDLLVLLGHSDEQLTRWFFLGEAPDSKNLVESRSYLSNWSAFLFLGKINKNSVNSPFTERH